MKETFHTTGPASPTTYDDGLSQETPDCRPTEDLVQYLKAYARAKPDVAALWCFGIGFVLGWKIKPW